MKSGSHVSFGILLFALAAVACQQDGETARGLVSETRDSAGIRIVENARPADGSRLPWQIGPEPSVSIGVLEGEEPYMLHYARDATKLSDGRIVVANGGSDELRVFDRSGTHVGTWGGQGEGPGEFTALGPVERWPGDSIMAWWAPRRAISVFDSDGNFGRTFRLESNDDDPIWIFLRPISVAGGGTILSTLEPEGVDTVVVELRDGEGRLQGSLGTHPGRAWYFAPPGASDYELWETIFGRELVTEPWRDRVVVSLNDRYEIKALRPDGTLDRIVRMEHPQRLPTPAEVEAHIEEQVAIVPLGRSQSEIEQYQAEVRRGFESVPVAEHYPAFESIMTDALDHLWVREYEYPGEERPAPLWTVFDPEGIVLGFVETPKGLRIYEIGEDYIMGHTRDELDVEYVQLWPLHRSGP